MTNKIELIREQVQKFHKKENSLTELVEGIDNILCSMSEAEFPFKNKIFQEWFTLEEANSILLDEGRENLKEYETNIINEALKNIQITLERYEGVGANS